MADLGTFGVRSVDNSHTKSEPLAVFRTPQYVSKCLFQRNITVSDCTHTSSLFLNPLNGMKKKRRISMMEMNTGQQNRNQFKNDFITQPLLQTLTLTLTLTLTSTLFPNPNTNPIPNPNPYPNSNTLP